MKTQIAFLAGLSLVGKQKKEIVMGFEIARYSKEDVQQCQENMAGHEFLSTVFPCPDEGEINVDATFKSISQEDVSEFVAAGTSNVVGPILTLIGIGNDAKNYEKALENYRKTITPIPPKLAFTPEQYKQIKQELREISIESKSIQGAARVETREFIEMYPGMYPIIKTYITKELKKPIEAKEAQK